jgi:hypothetical protein
MNRAHPELSAAPRRPAIVLGNGPSLKGFDFARLKPFDVFGMNAAYRYWDEIGWYPRFYSCLDDVVGLSHAGEIARLVRRAPDYGIERFLLRRELIDRMGRVENRDRIVDFDRLHRSVRQFSRLPMTTGSHTLIWAASLGFREIYILGVDCNYVEIVPGAEHREGTTLEITSGADNPNYFFAGYQQVGDKYNLPNTSRDLHLDSWRAAALSVREYGARALNANLQSRVDAFDFCRLDAVESGDPIDVIPRSAVVEEGAFWIPSVANAGSSPAPEISPRAGLPTPGSGGEASSPRPAGSLESAGGAPASAEDRRRGNEPMLGRLSQLTRRPVLMGAVVLLAALLLAAAVTHALPASSLGSLAPAVLFYVIAANLLFSAIVGWLVYASLKSRFKSLRRSIHWRLDDLIEQAKQRAEIEDQRTKLIISQLRQQAEAQEKIAEIIKQLKGGNGARDRDPP